MWKLRSHALSPVRTALPLLILLAACSDGRQRAPASAVLITLDTTRYDSLGANGGRAGITPHLDRLAAEGVSYDRAYTVAPLTLPAHASMLTGLYPPRHGLRNNGHGPLSPAATTLAEAARAGGLQTAAFLGSLVLGKNFGIEQGFERYEVPTYDLEGHGSFFPERAGAEVVAQAIGWLRERDRERRFFLWVHIFFIFDIKSNSI